MKTEEEKLRIAIYEPSKRIGEMQKFSGSSEIGKNNSNSNNSNIMDMHN